MAFLVPMFCFNGSVSFFTPVSNYLVHSLRVLLFSSTFVLEAATGTIIFFLLSVGVGFHPSLSSSGGGMILSSYSWTIYLTLFRGVGIVLILGLGTDLAGLTSCFNNSFINCMLLFCVYHTFGAKKCPHCLSL